MKSQQFFHGTVVVKVFADRYPVFQRISRLWEKEERVGNEKPRCLVFIHNKPTTQHLPAARTPKPPPFLTAIAILINMLYHMWPSFHRRFVFTSLWYDRCISSLINDAKLFAPADRKIKKHCLQLADSIANELATYEYQRVLSPPFLAQAYDALDRAVTLVGRVTLDDATSPLALSSDEQMQPCPVVEGILDQIHDTFAALCDDISSDSDASNSDSDATSSHSNAFRSLKIENKNLNQPNLACDSDEQQQPFFDEDDELDAYDAYDQAFNDEFFDDDPCDASVF